MNKPWDKLCGGCGTKMLCDEGDPDFRDDTEWGYCAKCFTAWKASRTQRATLAKGADPHKLSFAERSLISMRNHAARSEG